MVGLFGCFQNVCGLNAVSIYVGTITGPVRACRCACVCVRYIYTIYQPIHRPPPEC